jgi:Zn-finger nucleic acid-binding protein
MKCPIDGEALVMSDRSGVEIDYCPKCRGVWLDRGELDKIIERAAANAAPPTAARAPDARPAHPQPERQYRGDDDYRDRPYRKKRESWIGEIFDF